MAMVSYRHAQDGAKPPKRTVFEGNIAAMASGDVSRDGKTETGAGGVEIAGFIQPEEGFEDVVAGFAWNTRTVVVEDDNQPFRRMTCLDLQP